MFCPKSGIHVQEITIEVYMPLTVVKQSKQQGHNYGGKLPWVQPLGGTKSWQVKKKKAEFYHIHIQEIYNMH